MILVLWNLLNRFCDRIISRIDITQIFGDRGYISQDLFEEAK